MDEFRGDDRLRRSLSDDGTVLHRDDLIGVPAGLVEVVKHGDQRVPVFVIELREQVEQLDLVGDVEESRRFVEQQERCLLSEHHGHPDTLALASGELVDEP